MELTDIQAYEFIEISLKNDMDWHTTEIIRVNDKAITVILPKNLKRFFISDEIKCRFTDGKNTYLFDGEISDVIFKFPQALVIFVPGQVRKFDEFRKDKRYSTSLLAEIYKLKKVYGYVKDISRRGFCLHTKGYLEKGDDIGVTLFFNNGRQQIYFEGRVVRKEEADDFREYGIEIENIKYEEEDKYFKLVEELEKQLISPKL